uniref:Epidermal patterning factor-like protein n=1 Tax=Cicer arietinum TaxID=3827 RepID=A0A1S2Z1V5_CICAR|nr:uncharacterized protein LOC101495520 [Cicer arietinum]
MVCLLFLRFCANQSPSNLPLVLIASYKASHSISLILGLLQPTMKRRIMCYILFLTPLLFFGDANQQALSFKVVPTTRIQDVPTTNFETTQNEEALSRIGSRPPRCEHKCGECIPCNPIQIIHNNKQQHLQYTNYEPEGWKCKCGTSYFNP